MADAPGSEPGVTQRTCRFKSGLGYGFLYILGVWWIAHNPAKVGDQVRLLTRILMPAKLNWSSSALVRRRVWVRLPPLALTTRCQGRTARRSSAKRENRVRLPGASLQPRPTVRAYKPEQVLCDAGATCAAVIRNYCPVARWLCGRLLTGRVQVRVLPGQLSGRASQQARWHPFGRRARRKPLQVQVLSLPLFPAVAERRGARLIRGSR